MEGSSARRGHEARGYRLPGRRDADFGLDVDHGRAYRLERQCADHAGLLDHPRSGGGAVYASGPLGPRRVWRL